ncbi:MAG: tetratricopeptide repeat protein [Oscillospiraceae bacterium]|nr:tetratricopeptide repeat protein [Oscillospiraceae bacterium]
MQKKSKIIIISVVSAILLVVGVFTAIALTGKGNSIEKEVGEKLSLGQKFLLDLEYDKAVAEFQAVIDIEPKNVDAYIGLADAYIGMGEEEKAIETLEKGFMETGDEKIQAKLEEMKTPEETTAEVTTTPEETTTVPETTTTVATTAKKSGWTERKDYSDGSYRIIEYDSDGHMIKSSYYNADGTLNYYYINEYDSKGILIKNSFYNADGILDCYYTYEYYSYPGKYKKAYKYLPDGTLDSYSLFEYYESGYIKKQTWYYQSGGEGWHDWEDGEAMWAHAIW